MEKIDNLLTYVDVGCRWGINKRMDKSKRYNFDRWFSNISYIGFEPAIDEFNKLNESKKDNEMYYPYALWNSNDEKRRDFYICNETDWNSFYEPLPSKLHSIKESIKVKDTSKKQMYRLDSIIKHMDFIKIDVEGSELNVLKGCGHVLDTTLGINVEACALQIRKNQPTFEEIYKYLIDRDFLLFDIEKKMYYRTANLVEGRGQLIWGDFIFLKNYETLDDSDMIKKLLFIALGLKFFDYALAIAKDIGIYVEEVERIIEDYSDGNSRAKRIYVDDYKFWNG